MNECPYFCERRQNNAPEVFELEEVEHFFFLYDLFPATPGHTLVIPKRHFSEFRQLNEAEQAELPKAVIALYTHLESTDLKEVYIGFREQIFAEKPSAKPFIDDTIDKLSKNNVKPEAYNHGLNDGPAAGRTVNHLHYHVMPRWQGDVEDPRGGIRHMFAGKGNYKK